MVYLEEINKVLIIADYREVGDNNLFIYDPDGKLVARPEIPDLETTVHGVYSIWYIAGKTDQTVVFITPHQVDYEIKCNFNLIDYSFQFFH